MSATDIAAWVGAIIGTFVLLWDVFKWVHARPRIAVSAAPNMVAYGAAVAVAGEKPCVVVEATNVGDGKTTLTHLVGYYYDSWLKRIAGRKPTQRIVVPDPRPGQLPHVLDRGERWVGLMEQNDELQRMSVEGYLYVGVLHSTARRPVLTRLVIGKANEA